MKEFVHSALLTALPPVILFCGIYFFIYLRGFFVLHPIKTARLMFSGKSKLRELSVSLAGALGVGNIVGVAVAISLGGAGAVFWMCAAAFVTMSLKYCEILLAVRYRHGRNGGFFGGPMYYMRDGVGGRTGKTLAAIFSAFGLFGSVVMGNIVQTGAAVSSVKESIGIPKVVTGAIFCAVCLLVVMGGFTGISKFTSVAVPVMSALYIGFSVYALIYRREFIPTALNNIFSSAFGTDAMAGGIFGFLFSPAVKQGVGKGAYSNEAGGGTAPMAHAGADAISPAAQGTLGLFEVFFDTVVMCTLTALVILTSGVPTGGGGTELVITAFSVSCGPVAKYVIAISVMIFALSTVICWAHYGTTCLEYFTSDKKTRKIYLLGYCFSVMIGAFMAEDVAWELSDMCVATMTLVNVFSVVLLRRKVKAETDVTFGQKPGENRAAGLAPLRAEYKKSR